jgi:23S rRNA (cytosine1962-C5)-methyltransferase
MKTNYILLDSGNKKRLELFGDIKVVRPAVQADYKPALDQSKWDNPDLYFDGRSWIGEEKDFKIYFDDIAFSLNPGNNGQLGIFPEQVSNWQWLKKVNKDKSFKIINGFAYTGGSTLFSSNETNEIVHLDASKPAISRAKINAEISGKSNNNIRWVTEDVISFLKKEIKRGNKYQGFIFDPPAFGRGKKGEIWKLNKDLLLLFELINELSDGKPEFILISAHDKNLSLYKLSKIFERLKGINKSEVEKANLVISSKSRNHLKNGYYVRWYKR